MTNQILSLALDEVTPDPEQPRQHFDREAMERLKGAILAVGSMLEKAVVVDGALAVGRRMKMTISCDHRVMDGAMGARFLQDVKRLLEEPLRLLV